MNKADLEVVVGELSAEVIKGRAKDEVARMIAERACEIYGDQFIREVCDSITIGEVREAVKDEIISRIIREWKES